MTNKSGTKWRRNGPVTGLARQSPALYGDHMILLRHGQSEFNLHFAATRRDPGIIDPRLTELGHTQAREAAQQLAGQGIERIIVSPYSRTLQTVRPVAAALGLQVTIDPIVRERYAFACDIGSPRHALEREWPDHDFGLIDEIWWPNEEEPEHGIVDRAARFRAELSRRHDWTNTLVVSHWGFILSLTGKSVANGQWLRCDPTEPAPENLVWRA